jgi:hypothetical protein
MQLTWLSTSLGHCLILPAPILYAPHLGDGSLSTSVDACLYLFTTALEHSRRPPLTEDRLRDEAVRSVLQVLYRSNTWIAPPSKFLPVTHTKPHLEPSPVLVCHTFLQTS